ncbi:Kinase VIP2 domain containing protein [Pandoravirus macleodensis]|uniref:Kinase VIP2 domain containing protein n=1 Tax=Pandoravirus macleodensis TaxID=2107707 RepID=A0A2U7UEE8_9VIRU|nr:Kinase VIP2 domain containing protein [Pandoravirus macleodensis]AVK76813.1 Kinase VIP2 domain containing protein [Pandoravirus macleodensis]
MDEPGSPMQRRRRYAVYVSRVLSDTVVKALQSVRGDVGAVVTGERAYNALVGAAYRTEAVEWSVAAWGSASASARVAVAIAEAVGDTVARQSTRLAVIDDHFGTRLAGLVLVRDRTGGRSRFDLVVRTERWDFVLASVRRRAGPPADAVLFDDVLFSGPTTVVRGLYATANDPNANALARQRAVRLARAFAEASTQGRMSANLYRHLFLGGPAARARAVAVGVLSDEPGAARRAMAGRVAATAMGPVDTVVIAAGVPVERPRPQFSVSAADVAAHDAYIRALPARTRRALLAYTGPASGPINLALLDRFFGSGASVPSSARANVDLNADDENENDPLAQAALIQEALLGAPTLMASVHVYKVSRFLYFGGAPRCPDGCANMGEGPANDKRGERGTATTNYGLRAGDVERQWVFNSTTMDAWLDFGPFLDEFASCCAFVVRIPAGTRGALIIGRNSVYPNEYEVLLPYGCAFAVRQRRQASEVTYRGLAQRDRIFYQDTVVYEVDYVEPEAASPAQVDAATTRYAAQASTQGPMRIDMAKALATPAHAAAVNNYPHLARVLASLLANHIEAGLALPGFADGS